ncbi:MAG: glycosyltransferase family 2 protein, partial [Rhodothalassiaceae bacterium]
MFETAVDFLRQINLESAIYVFWYFFIFDLPRYTFGILSLALTDLAKLWRFLGPPGSSPEFPVETPVSVLLVGHNEGAKLVHCIRSIREQTMTDLEIIVVDDGSSDNMRAVGHGLLREGWIHQFLSTGLRGGKASALNLGFSHCTRPIVISADIDTTFDRDAFHRIIQPMADPQVGAVAGNLGVRNAWASVLAGFQALQYYFSISLGRQFTSSIETLGIVSGAFGAFRRQAVRQVGAWDVGPGDDSNLTMKLR